MTASSSALERSSRAASRPWRPAAFAASVAAGASAGVVLADTTLGALATVWTRFLYPAYDEMIRNGLLAWCM